MVKLKIDEYEVEAEEGLTLMEVIDSIYMQLTEDVNEIKEKLPRLCNHEALEPYAACRLCLVEVEKNGKKSIDTSCNYKIKEGLKVKTNTKEVKEARKMSLELLLAKAPDSEILKHMAFQMGVRKNERYQQRGDNYLADCIDCGLCARACEEVVGKAAITIAGRGTDKRVTMPCVEFSECIGCGLCYHICPTDAIKMEEKDGKRTIWGKEFEMVKCKSCNEDYATKEMIEYRKELLKNVELPEEFFTKCPKCYDTKDEKMEIDTKYVVDILKNICKDCKRCVDACPKGLLSKTEDFNAKGYASIRWDPLPRGLKKEDLEKVDPEKLSCAGCQACYRACPESSIDIYTKKPKVKIIK